MIATGGTIPAGTGIVDGACYIEVNVVSTAAGNWPNIIPANGPANGFTPGGTVSGFQAMAGRGRRHQLDVRDRHARRSRPANPDRQQDFLPSPALVNEPITLTITLANPNTVSTIPLTTFTDPLPAGMQVAPHCRTRRSTARASGAVNGVVTRSGGQRQRHAHGRHASARRAPASSLSASSCPRSPARRRRSPTRCRPTPSATRAGLASATFNRALIVNSPITLAKAFVTTAGGTTAIANPIPVNQVFWLRVDIINASTLNPLNITTFTDTFPAGMVVACRSADGGLRHQRRWHQRHSSPQRSARARSR